jgi:secondary thiamine-phosphate synthase enzyme
MPVINVKSSSHSQMINITSKIAQLIPKEMENGICHVFCMHTTAGLTINENADPAVQQDLQAALERIVPWNSTEFTHFEGNSAAHLKASLMGFAQTIPIENWRLHLGTWQGIYFCEFDGPRERQVHVTFIPGVAE